MSYDTVTWSTSGGKMTVVDRGETFTSTYVVTSTTLSVTTMEGGKAHTENYVRLGSSIPPTIIPSTPVFSPAGGTFSTSQTVIISNPDGKGTIRYTTDGTAPTNSSLSYTGPIVVSSSRTIKAVVAVDGISSSVASASFVIDPGATGGVGTSPVGTWRAHESDTSEGMRFTMDVTISFSANGVFTVNTKFDADGFSQDTTEIGTWSVSGNKLTTTLDGKASVLTYTIRGNELVVTEDGADEMVFTRVVGARAASTGSAMGTDISSEAIQAWLGIDLQRLVSASARLQH